MSVKSFSNTNFSLHNSRARAMDKLVKELADAHASGNGYVVAQLLLPLSPPDQPDRLRSIARSTNAASVKKDVTRAMRRSSYISNLTNEEFTGWVDILAAYWKAVSAIVPLAEHINDNDKVRPHMYYSGKEVPLSH